MHETRAVIIQVQERYNNVDAFAKIKQLFLLLNKLGKTMGGQLISILLLSMSTVRFCLKNDLYTFSF